MIISVSRLYSIKEKEKGMEIWWILAEFNWTFYNTVEPPFNIPQLTLHFSDLKSTILVLDFLYFKTLLSLVSTSIAPQRNLKQGFYCSTYNM